MDAYAAAGVDYDVLDAGKRAAVAAALSTSKFSESRGVVSNDASRGESAFLFELGGTHMATVLECLGTKSSIARKVQDTMGHNHFDAIAYDSVAAIVNDLICVGAMPLVINAYFATGSPDWYGVDGRFAALVDGWKNACEDAGATWGGGESPGLSGIVVDGEVDLAGSAVGAVPAGVTPVLGEQLAEGDSIVFVASNGLHANGASMVRRLAAQLPDGYATEMPSGATFGDAVLSASAMYVALVEKLLADETHVSYLSHITGHGLRKVMRADKQVTYRITQLPPVPEVLSFMVDKMELSDEEAYGTFNMGAGFAVFTRDPDAVIAAAQACGQQAWNCGVVEAGARQVVVEPIGVTYQGEALNLR